MLPTGFQLGLGHHRTQLTVRQPKASMNYLKNVGCIAIAAVLLLAGCGSRGQEQPAPGPSSNQPAPSPAPPKQPGVKDLKISAVTQTVNAPRARPGDAVRVVLTDVNPFIYEYTFQEVERPTTEASFAEFFKVVLGITVPSAGSIEDTKRRKGFEMNLLVCRDEIRTILSTRRSAASRRMSPLQARFSILDSLINKHKELTDIVRDPNQTAPKVKEAAQKSAVNAQELKTQLSESRLAAIESGIALLEEAIADLEQKINEVTEEWKSKNSGLCRDIASANGYAEDLKQELRVSQDNLANLQQTKTDIDSVNIERLAVIAKDPSSFYKTHLLAYYDRPVLVDVTVLRRPAGSEVTKNESHLSHRLWFGGRPRHSFAAGAGWANFTRYTYGTMNTRVIAPGGSTGDTLVNRIVARDQATQIVFPTVTFNTRMLDLGDDATLQLVFGVGLRQPVSSPHLGFSFGGGLDLFQRVGITGGFLFTERETLAGGLQIGDRIPVGMTTVPVEKRLVGRPGVWLTYNIHAVGRNPAAPAATPSAATPPAATPPARQSNQSPATEQ